MKTKLAITGMHCSMCALTIDERLEEVTGVRRAKTSYAKQSVEVEYDPSLTSVKSLLQAVSAAGYSATEK